MAMLAEHPRTVLLRVNMAERKRVIDGRGRTWTISKVGWDEAAEEDFQFWYEGLTPEERVEAAGDALEGRLKTRGLDAVPRLRRAHRRIERAWGEVSGGRRPRGRLPRTSARHQRP